MTVTRRQAREWAIQMLTAHDLNPSDDPEAEIAAFWEQLKTLEEDDGGVGGREVNRRMTAFTEERVRGVLENRAEIDAALDGFLKDWPLDRLGTVERAVLRMGAWEIAHSDVPTGVVVNEAVDLVNWYAAPKSRQLINAVLDRFAKSHATAKTAH